MAYHPSDTFWRRDMLRIKPETKLMRLWLSWTIATALGWLLIVYPGLNLRDETIFAWNMLPAMAWKLFINTIALGLIVGLLQHLLLRFDTRISNWWIAISTVSYAFGSSLAFLISAAGIGLGNPRTLSSQGEEFLSMPLALTMLTGGALAGLIQAYALKNSFSVHRGQKILLWILGTALGWSLGFFATSYGWRLNVPLYLQSAFAGLIIGAVTGMFLLIQLRDEPRN